MRNRSVFSLKSRIKKYKFVQYLLPIYRVLKYNMKSWPVRLYVKMKYQKKNMQTIFFKGLKFSEPHNTSYILNIVKGNTSFENEINSIVKKINVEKPVIFDIGANVGMVTILLSKKIKNSIIYSFEPNNATFYFFKKNIDDNNINAIAVNKGLSDKCEKLFLGPPHKRQHSRYQLDKGHPGLYSVYADKSDKWVFKHGKICDFLTLDYFCEKKGIKWIDFIKIDVEGHEVNVLKGGINILKACKPICKIEVNLFTSKIAQKNPKELFDILYSLNYDIYMLESGRFIKTNYNMLINKEGFLNEDIYAFYPDKTPK